MNQELREKLGIRKFPNFEGVKVPIKLLKEISDKNYEVLNRSIHVDMIIKHHPEVTHLTCVDHIGHHHAFGKQVKAHYRIIFQGPNGGILTQDMWKEQWSWCNDVYDMEKEANIVN